MTIGVIYCETLESEIRAVAGRFPAVGPMVAMPWGLHIEPDRLLEAVRTAIEEIQDRVDAIVLGYGRCQALDRLGDGFRVPVLRPEGEDCIGVVLGQDRYDAELKREAGTWFLSAGWTRLGTDFVFRELQINRVAPRGVEPLQLARRMLDGFSRALYIETGSNPGETDLKTQAAKIADDLGLRLETTCGSHAAIEAVFRQALAFSSRRTADRWTG